jgi:hypothetical protein
LQADISRLKVKPAIAFEALLALLVPIWEAAWPMPKKSA